MAFHARHIPTVVETVVWILPLFVFKLTRRGGDQSLHPMTIEARSIFREAGYFFSGFGGFVAGFAPTSHMQPFVVVAAHQTIEVAKFAERHTADHQR